MHSSHRLFSGAFFIKWMHSNAWREESTMGCILYLWNLAAVCADTDRNVLVQAQARAMPSDGTWLLGLMLSNCQKTWPVRSA